MLTNYKNLGILLNHCKVYKDFQASLININKKFDNPLEELSRLSLKLYSISRN